MIKCKKCDCEAKEGGVLCPQCQDRKDRNDRLCRAVKNKQFIPPLVDPSWSFFPPKPLIQKDKDAVDKLYGKDDEPKKDKPKLTVIKGDKE